MLGVVWIIKWTVAAPYAWVELTPISPDTDLKDKVSGADSLDRLKGSHDKIPLIIVIIGRSHEYNQIRSLEGESGYIYIMLYYAILL